MVIHNKREGYRTKTLQELKKNQHTAFLSSYVVMSFLSLTSLFFLTLFTGCLTPFSSVRISRESSSSILRWEETQLCMLPFLHYKMGINDEHAHLLPHGTVCPCEVICTVAIQIRGLLFAVFFTVFFVNTLNCSEVRRPHML